MKKLLSAIASASLLAAGSTAAAQPAGPNPVIAPEPALGDPMPDRVVGFDNGIVALADVTFWTLPGFRPLVLDLYKTKEAGPARPLVIYIHGGGWMAGHTRQSGAFSNFPGVLADLAARGYVVASLEYRLSREAPFPAAIQDVKAAVRFLRANAARFGIDPSKVALWGGSAGGQLAGLAALSCGASAIDPKDKPHPDQSDCVQGAVGWYGVYDFASMPSLAPLPSTPSTPPAPPGTPTPDRIYLDCVAACPADRVAAASPVTYVDSKDPPMLLIHGTDDKVVPAQQSRLLRDRLKNAGTSVELVEIPDVGHSWIGRDPAATQAASLRALNLTFGFFDKLFGTRR